MAHGQDQLGQEAHAVKSWKRVRCEDDGEVVLFLFGRLCLVLVAAHAFGGDENRVRHDEGLGHDMTEGREGAKQNRVPATLPFVWLSSGQC